MIIIQKGIKYLVLAVAVFLLIIIVAGVFSVTGLIGNRFKGGNLVGDMQTYSVGVDVKNLDIVIKAADICIKEGDVFSVESNLKNLKIEEKNSCLIIEDKTKVKDQLFGVNSYEGAVLTLYVSAGTVFDHIDLTTGAGRLTADILSAVTIDFEFGAGEVTIGSLVAAKAADIEGGAGQIAVSGGTIKNLDLKMGVGQLNLNSMLAGECSINAGVGEMNIILLGNQEDYKLDLEKGLGNISVDGNNISIDRNIGNGINEVEIHGGIGAIHVKFKER